MKSLNVLKFTSVGLFRHCCKKLFHWSQRSWFDSLSQWLWFVPLFLGLWPHSDSCRRHRWSEWLPSLEGQVSKHDNCMHSNNIIMQHLPKITGAFKNLVFQMLCQTDAISISAIFSFRWEQFDKNYLSKLLLRKSVYHKSELWEAYQKINIRDAISVIDQVTSGLPTQLLRLSISDDPVYKSL